MQRLHDPIAWLTAITAVLAVLIAYRQDRTAKTKLRLDLFEKRYAVYQPAMTLITSVVRSRDVTIDQVVMYNAATNDAGFLFGDEIVEFLAKVRAEAISLSAGNANLREVQYQPTKIEIPSSGRGASAWCGSISK